MLSTPLGETGLSAPAYHEYAGKHPTMKINQHTLKTLCNRSFCSTHENIEAGTQWVVGNGIDVPAAFKALFLMES